MKHIFDDGRARATVLRFGRLSSELLAWGAADGTVRVAVLGDAPRLLHVRPSLLRLPPSRVSGQLPSPDPNPTCARCSCGCAAKRRPVSVSHITSWTWP